MIGKDNVRAMKNKLLNSAQSYAMRFEQKKDSEPKSNSIERRGFLRGTATSAASAVAFTSVSAAKKPSISEEKKKQVTAPYENVKAVQTILQANQDILDLLVDQDVISEASFSNLGLDELKSVPSDGVQPWIQVNARRVAGKVTPVIKIQTFVKTGEVIVGFMPELDDRSVLFVPDGENPPSLADQSEVRTNDEGNDIVTLEATQADCCCGSCPSGKECICDYRAAYCDSCPPEGTCVCYGCACRCTSCDIINCIFECA